MLTGSLVSSLQGEPRATHDIDFVIAIHPVGIKQLVKAFPPPKYYIDEQAAFDAVAKESMFNLVDVKQGYKIDFWILTNDPFDQSRFSRRQRESINNAQVFVSSPEDTILMKLKWAKLSGGSEKQFKDCIRIYEVQFGSLDQAYLDSWAKRLTVTDLLQQLRKKASPPAGI